MSKTALTQVEGLTEVNQSLQLLWWFGDWQAIVSLTDVKPSLADTNFTIDIYRAAALYQLGKFQEAKLLLNSIQLTGSLKNKLAELLISGVYNCLAKASSCIGDENLVDSFFISTIRATTETAATSHLVTARKVEQLAQLGLPVLSFKRTDAEFKPEIEQLLHELLRFEKDNAYLHLALAELALVKTDFQSAIVHWQAVVAGFGSDTPQIYYDRLKLAYDKAGRYPLATDEEEVLRGDKDKHELLHEIHLLLRPSLYLEIGVESGKSLSFAKCNAIGIDPMPRVNHNLGVNTQLLTCTSDEFFAHQASTHLRAAIELAFIDGMHLFEFALRDFINVEKFSAAHTLIIIDDIFPGHAAQADRDRRTRAWTGDVWKLHKILTRYRPDLFIVTLDIHPTGLMLISGLDSRNTALEESYDEAVSWLKDEPVPVSYVTRDDAWSGKDIRIKKLINVITSAKSIRTSAKNLVDDLAKLAVMKNSD
jgi:hypothetical protein